MYAQEARIGKHTTLGSKLLQYLGLKSRGKSSILVSEYIAAKLLPLSATNLNTWAVPDTSLQRKQKKLEEI